jgi:hypothetical protein
VNKFLVIVVLGLLLGGCASPKTAADYMGVKESSLCVNYINNYGFFDDQTARYEAIKRRGIDCNEYRELAQSIKDKREETSKSLNEVWSSGVDAAYGIPPKSDGKKMVCTTQRIGTSGMAKTTCREK